VGAVDPIPDAEHRSNAALALCLACMSFKGDKFDMAQLMSLADEYLDYIEGDDASPIPRPDKTGGALTLGPVPPRKK
jgi:hypothetical protein